MAINFEEAEQDAKNEIAECNAHLAVIAELKGKLENGEDLTTYLTECKYHECCETLLRNDDDFGKLLTLVMPCLSYTGSGSNYFYYTCEGYPVKIPNSRCCGIDIVLPHYSKVITSKESLLRFSYYTTELQTLNKSIKLWEDYFNAVTLLDRAKIVVQGKLKLLRYLYRLAVKRDAYNSNNLKEKLQSLYAQRAELEEEMKCKYQKYLDEQLHYRAVLSVVLPKLLKWTETVRVRTSDEGNNTVASFTKSNYVQDLAVDTDITNI